jgi:hypothetical protein
VLVEKLALPDQDLGPAVKKLPFDENVIANGGYSFLDWPTLSFFN